MRSQFITKQEALEILGWHSTPRAGEEKLKLLKKMEIISSPQHAPRMYVRAELEAVIDRFGADLFFRKNNDLGKYELIKAS